MDWRNLPARVTESQAAGLNWTGAQTQREESDWGRSREQTEKIPSVQSS